METKQCSKCGEVKSRNEYSIVQDRIKKNGDKTLRENRICKECVRKWHSHYAKRNRNKINKNQNERRKQNPDKYKESKKLSDYKYSKTKKGIEVRKKASAKYYKNNKSKCNETNKRIRDNSIRNLSDSYVIQKLLRKGFTKNQLETNKDLTCVYREILKIKRQIKTQEL